MTVLRGPGWGRRSVTGVLAALALVMAPVGTQAAPDPANDTVVEVASLPRSLDEFVALRDQLARTPEGGVATFLVAAWLYTQDQALGEKAFTIAYTRAHLGKSKRGYKGWAVAQSTSWHFARLRKDPWMPNTYFEGARREDGYRLPRPPLRLRMFRNRFSNGKDGAVRILVRTSGADTPRPFTVIANRRGVWKIKEGSSLFVGMKPPAPPEDEVDDL